MSSASVERFSKIGSRPSYESLSFRLIEFSVEGSRETAPTWQRVTSAALKCACFPGTTNLHGQPISSGNASALSLAGSVFDCQAGAGT